MGTSEFAVPILVSLHLNWQIPLVITQPDRPAGRGRRLSSSPVKEKALNLELKVSEPEKIKDNPILLAELSALAPELIVVAAYGKILPPELLNLAHFGVLNLHPSLLPRHRGPSPIQGTILANDEVTGVTLMKMVLAVDSGPILAQTSPLPIGQKTAGELSHKLAEQGAELLSKNLPAFFAGILPQTPQDENQATFTQKITREDARINWQKPAELLVREIRAYNPWPVSYTAWLGEQGLKLLKIYQAQASPEQLSPGRVAQTEGQLVIGTGRGSLLIEKIQLEGKKILPGDVFLKGQRGLLGTILNGEQD